MKNKALQFIIKIRSFSKKQIIWSLVGVIVVVGIVYGAVGNSTPPTIVMAEKGRIEEEVLMTGKVISHTEVNLGFERSGKIQSARVDVGDEVSEGEVLATLEASDLAASRAKAVADLNEETVKLNSVVRTSSLTRESAESEARRVLQEVYAEANDAIRKNADQFFQNPRSNAPTLAVAAINNGISYIIDFNIPSKTKSKLEYDRTLIEDTLNNMEKNVAGISSLGDYDAAFKNMESDLYKVQNFLIELGTAMGSLNTYYDTTYETTIQGYKDRIASARADVTAVAASLQTAKDKLKKSEVLSGVDGADYPDVLAGRARIASLEANLKAIDADISKTIIRAPIHGVVTMMDANVGEIVSPNTSLITVISDDKLQVEANLSEINVSKVSVGNSVSIEFDGLPGRIIEGIVAYVDPAAKMVDGVATYKVTVTFKDPAVQKEIRSGLTANLKVLTKFVNEAIKVPAYAVERRGDASFVKIVGRDGVEDKEVTTGLRGKDGSIQILSGIAAGQQVQVSK
jgi:multidrug efflux pump subunit AcrA (membrane-fusion protein)